MFDFYFGTEADVKKREPDFLVFIKRMLPRWCNSIPDSEFLALHELLEEQLRGVERPVLAETGTGASTLVLLHHALKRGGVLYSWDTSGPKGSFIRGVACETLLVHHKRNIHDHWKFIACSSLSGHLGLPILAEKGEKVDACFLDSEHTRDVLLGELERLNPVLKDEALVAIDDANYAFIHTNTAYINMPRKKLGLGPVAEIAGNKGDEFHVEAERFLRGRWSNVEHLKDSYKTSYQSDMFWDYYKADRDVMGRAGMEKTDALDHRFDAWRVRGRLPAAKP